MLKLTQGSMSNAIAKARYVRPKVRVISADNRTYAVYGSRGDAYTVRFAVAGANKLGERDYPAGSRGMTRHHISCAASADTAAQSMRKAVA
jgi:hypothetical protein